MPIYKYTMKKYMMSWSTWIIIAVSFLFTFILGGWLPFQFLNPESPTALSTYMGIYVALISAVTAFLAIFTSIFAGFKSAQMFKDEVEDGTFLLLLSKPITRGKIIFNKWLALQTVMMIFTFTTAFTFMLGLLIFDKGSQIPDLVAINTPTLRASSWLIALTMWGLLTIFGFIFSSIALLISTKMSTGTTIGISIAIGVIIPMTGMVSMFTKHSEVYSMNNSGLESANSGVRRLNMEYDDNAGSVQAMYDAIVDVIAESGQQGADPIASYLQSHSPEEAWRLIMGTFSKYYDFATSNEGLYNVGIDSGVSDVYDGAWVSDLNFQVQQISSIASDVVVPKEAQAVAEDNLSGTIYASTRFVPIGALKDVSGSTQNQNYIFDLIQLNNENVSMFRSAMNYLFLLTNHYIVQGYPIKTQDGTIVGQTGGFSKSNIALLKTSQSFKFKIDKFIGDDILNFIFDKNGTSTEVQDAPTNNWVIDGQNYVLDFMQTQELIDTLLIVELEYLKAKSSNIVDALYGELARNMYQNHQNYSASSDILEKQSYLIPEITKLLMVNYTHEFASTVKEDGIDESSDQLISLYKYMLSFAEMSTTPLSSMIFNSQKLTDKVRANGITIIKQTGYDIDNTNPSSANYDYMFNPLNLYGEELNIYNALYSANAENPELLQKMERKPYVNKYGLLGFYAGLALILVPLSYALIRKQDYR